MRELGARNSFRQRPSGANYSAMSASSAYVVDVMQPLRRSYEPEAVGVDSLSDGGVWNADADPLQCRRSPATCSTLCVAEKLPTRDATADRKVRRLLCRYRLTTPRTLVEISIMLRDRSCRF